MTDLLDKLWPAFVSEVTEQLDSVELLLAKSGSSKKLDVNQLFRNFHTIKGNCSMIGFTSMEVVAHRSEDILAVVRNGEMSMDDDVIDILLDAVSRLKKQFNSANESRENPTQDDELVAELEGFVEKKMQSQNADADTSVATLSDQDRAENISALSVLSKMAVPSLILGLDANAKVEQVVATVDSMSEKTRALGFTSLTRNLLHYVAELSSEHTDQFELLAIAAEIFDDIRFVCDEHNIDLSLELGAKLCRAKLQKGFNEQLVELSELLAELENDEIADWRAETFMALVSKSFILANYSSLFLYAELNACWRYIKQLVVELSRGYIAFNHAMISAIASISKEAQALSLQEEDSVSFSPLLDDLQQATAKHNNASDEILDLKQSIVDVTTLCIDSMVDLGLDVLKHIKQSIDDGLLAIEIDIDFRNEEVAEKLLTAARNIGELVHSRTMFHDLVNGVAQRTSFALLILTNKPLEDIDKVLSIIDKGSNSYTILDSNNQELVEEQSATDENVPEQAGQPASEDHADDEELDEQSATADLVKETSQSMGALKVDGKAIDQLIANVGELITLQHRIDYVLEQESWQKSIQAIQDSLQTIADVDQRNKALAALDQLKQTNNTLNETSESLQASIQRTQNSVLDLRVVPISYVFDRFHGFVRTIGKKLGKKAVLDVTGEHVKVDKGMIDVLSEPLAHMIRNSLDHGLEPPEERKSQGKEELGLIKLKAEQQNGMIYIHIHDDGRGINTEYIVEKATKMGLMKSGIQYSDQQIFDMIFAPGFSTSKILTETSGRGVGMDVVKSKITQIGGSITVESELGKGTKISLILPVSAAIQSVILFKSQDQVLAIPERFVTEVMSINKSDIQIMKGQSVFMLRDSIVPVYPLDGLLNNVKKASPESIQSMDTVEVIVLASETHTLALVVEETVGRSEVLVRETHSALRSMNAVSAAAVLGDGNVVIILDGTALFGLAQLKARDILSVA